MTHTNTRPTKAEQIQDAIRRRGLQVQRIGQAYRIRGHGINIDAASLDCLDLADLKRPKFWQR